MSTKAAIYVDGSAGEVSDGYHTFNELYMHRHALFLALAKRCPALTWKSRRHQDGKGLPGWFIGGINLPAGVVTYHLPEQFFNTFPGIELDFAPKWDGHTSKDVIARLLGFAQS